MNLMLPSPKRLIVVALLAAALSACSAIAPARPAPQPPAAMPPTPLPEQDSWILVDLPPDATQLDHGAEIYRLVCSACHAHSGEGLTDAWRATWNPADQNCWQSKCHAANHPPDGFELPIAPAVVGREALAPFQTAADLRAYIQATMPWHAPNSLTESEGWAVTAYVIKLNRMNPGPELNAGNGSQYRLHTDSAQTQLDAAAAASQVSLFQNPLALAAGAVFALLVLVLLWRGLRRATASASR